MTFISGKTSIFPHSWVPGTQTLGTRTTLLTFFPLNTGLLVQPWTEEHIGTSMPDPYREKIVLLLAGWEYMEYSVENTESCSNGFARHSPSQTACDGCSK